MNASSHRSQKDELIQQLTQIVLENLHDEQFGVSELAEKVGMNRSNLYRKVISLTKKSLSQFIREIRLSEALKILREEQVTVSEAAYRVGFSTPSYFNCSFHDHYGFPPGEAKHVNLEKTIRPKKREEGPMSRRFNFTKKNTFIAILLFLGIVSTATVLILIRDNDTIEERSIAVLPFINDSPGEENAYFINGIMEEILLNLQTINDLRVISRNSVEQYRSKNRPSTPEIAKELGVNYILEGSGQKYGNTIVLRVQLIEGSNDKHLWGESYQQEIESIEVIINIQNRIAESIAAELKAVITPLEKQLIVKIPTTNLTAYDFYQRGREEQEKYWLDSDNRDALERAEELYHKALECDSTFAKAYTGLANVYGSKHYWETYFTENFLDSMLLLADIALSFDNQLAEAYVIRGEYYRYWNKHEQAINEYDKALKFNPNSWEAYRNIGELYIWKDYLKYFENMQKAASLHRGPFLPKIYESIGLRYAHLGFKEKGLYYIKEKLRLDDDSASYYYNLACIVDCYSNFEKAIEFGEKAYAIDSTQTSLIRQLGSSHMCLGHFKESLEYFKKLEDIEKAQDKPYSKFFYQIGYAYWVNGFKEEGASILNAGMEKNYELIELGRTLSRDLNRYYTLAAIYAILGDQEKAFENLRLFSQCSAMPLWMIKRCKNDPYFDHFREKPEFQEIVRDAEANYQAGHERIRKWLEENEML